MQLRRLLGMAALFALLAACSGAQPSGTPSAAPGEQIAMAGSGLAPVALPPATLEARPEGRLIDAHAHIGGPELATTATAVMDENGIDYLFNLSGGSPRRGMAKAIALEKATGGRVLSFMVPYYEGIDEPGIGETLAAELRISVTKFGYAGLKIPKSLGLYLRDDNNKLVAVDDPRLFPLWREAGSLGVPILIHVADPAAFWKPSTPDNERFEELAAHPRWSFADSSVYPPREELLRGFEALVKQFPATSWVGVHACHNAEDLTYIDRMLSTYPNLHMDIGARLPELGRHPAGEVRSLFEKFADRILFATDIGIMQDRAGGTVFTLGSSGEEPDRREAVKPFYDAHHRYLETGEAGIAHPTPIQGRWTVDAIALSAATLDKIYYLNAYRLMVGPTLQRRAKIAAGIAP
jgi:predicted TIM-barrel fold metal-dependent hydrolase